jgi:tetratricopeptide (TPR) repeat protein
MGAYVRWWFEDAGEAALEDLRRGLSIAEELDDKGLRIDVHDFMGTILYNVGDLKGAEEQFERRRELASDVGSLRDEARVTFQLALVRYHLGEIDDAESLGLQALDWLERTGDSFFQLQNLRTLALCALARSDLDLAEARLQQAVPIALDIGGAQVVETYRHLVTVLIRQGRLNDARELGEFAFRDLPEEDIYARAAGLLIKGSITTADGLFSDACECFEEALRLLEQQRLPLDLGEGRLAYGKALRRLGDDSGAEAQLRGAREHLANLGARGLVDEIDRELAEIGEGAGQTGPLAST